MSNKQINIEETCHSLHAALGELIKFKADDRFVAALGEFKTDVENKIHEILGQHFVHCWDVSNIEEASETVQAACASLGGMMEGQFFMTVETENEDILFCAWWPWSNGITLSIRIGPYFADLSDDQKKSANAEFMSYFSL